MTCHNILYDSSEIIEKYFKENYLKLHDKSRFPDLSFVATHHFLSSISLSSKVMKPESCLWNIFFRKLIELFFPFAKTVFRKYYEFHV